MLPAGLNTLARSPDTGPQCVPRRARNATFASFIPMAPPYLSLIVPAFNEVNAIAGTLASIATYLDRQGFDYEVIVAADGNDGTRGKVAEIAARDPRVSVIGSAERGGKGRGVRNGVFKATGEVIGFVDADYKTPIEEFEKLRPFLDAGEDLVIGSREVSDACVEVAQPLHRRLG